MRRRGASLAELIIALLILLVGLLAVSRIFLVALLAQQKAANRQAATAAVQQIVEEMREAGVSGLGAYAGDKVLWRKTVYKGSTGQVLKVQYLLLPASANPGGGQNQRFGRIGTFSVTLSPFCAKVQKARIVTTVGATRNTQARLVTEALFAQE